MALGHGGEHRVPSFAHLDDLGRHHRHDEAGETEASVVGEQCLDPVVVDPTRFQIVVVVGKQSVLLATAILGEQSGTQKIGDIGGGVSMRTSLPIHDRKWRGVRAFIEEHIVQAKIAMSNGPGAGEIGRPRADALAKAPSQFDDFSG